jgi:hypothetical protein
MWKICQVSTSKSKVITQHSKPLPRQRHRRNLAGFIVKPGIIKIESKNKRGRPTGGLFHCPPRPANGTSDPGEFRSSPGSGNVVELVNIAIGMKKRYLKTITPKNEQFRAKRQSDNKPGTTSKEGPLTLPERKNRAAN